MAIPYVHVVGYDCASLEQKVPCIDLTCRLHGKIREVQYFINQQYLVWLYILSAIIILLFNKSPLLFVSKIGPDGSIPMIAEKAKCVSISLGKQFICRFIQIIQIAINNILGYFSWALIPLSLSSSGQVGFPTSSIVTLLKPLRYRIAGLWFGSFSSASHFFDNPAIPQTWAPKPWPMQKEGHRPVAWLTHESFSSRVPLVF